MAKTFLAAFPSEQADVEAAIEKAKAELAQTNQTTTKISEIETKIDKAKVNQDRIKVANSKELKLDIPGFVGNNVKKVPTINRVGVKRPTSITANRKSTDG